MIPKVIHYCWFGRNPLPELAVKCIASWKKYLPDYEIKEWNEDNFDVNIVPYTSEAYVAKKYAFVSDYARFWILYHHGGLYFDTDVEVVAPIDDIIARGSFMGCEREATGATVSAVAPGLGLGANPGLGLYADLLAKYSKIHFIAADGTFNQTTIVEYTSDLLSQKGLKAVSGIQLVDGIYIYPKEYFCPLGLDGVMRITSNTRSIHHYMASWSDKRNPIKKEWLHFKSWLQKVLPLRLVNAILGYKKGKRDKRNKELFGA